MSVRPLNMHSNPPTDWFEMTSLFDNKSKTSSVSLNAFHFIHENSIYLAQHDRRKERIFVHLFDEHTNTYSHGFHELARGPKNGLLINQKPESELRETDIVKAMRASQGKTHSVSDCLARKTQGKILSALNPSLERVPCDFASYALLKEKLSTLPGPLTVWSKINDLPLNWKITFVHKNVEFQAWRELDSGQIHINSKNHKFALTLYCDTEGNLLVDGVSWEELAATFEGLDKMHLVCSLYDHAVGEELRINAQFAEKQQHMQKATRPFLPLVEHELPDLLGGGDFGLPRTLPAITREQRQINRRSVGVASTIGRKKEMEDESVTAGAVIQTQTKKYPLEVFAVLDGHCGEKAAIFVRQNLVSYLVRFLVNENPTSITEQGVIKAAKLCYKQLDADFPSDIDGTTALTAFILNGQLWVVNTGDSRAVIVKDGKVIQATEDQKPEIPRYRKIIEELGGEITHLHRTHKRVNVKLREELAVARSIGDKRFVAKSTGKCVIVPDPEITRYALKDIAGGHLLLACDGLFDYTTTDQVGGAIQAMHKAGFTTERMAKHLVFSAYKIACSEDNLTALVIKL